MCRESLLAEREGVKRGERASFLLGSGATDWMKGVSWSASPLKQITKAKHTQNIGRNINTIWASRQYQPDVWCTTSEMLPVGVWSQDKTTSHTQRRAWWNRGVTALDLCLLSYGDWAWNVFGKSLNCTSKKVWKPCKSSYLHLFSYHSSSPSCLKKHLQSTVLQRPVFMAEMISFPGLTPANINVAFWKIIIDLMSHHTIKATFKFVSDSPTCLLANTILDVMWFLFYF